MRAPIMWFGDQTESVHYQDPIFDFFDSLHAGETAIAQSVDIR